MEPRPHQKPRDTSPSQSSASGFIQTEPLCGFVMPRNKGVCARTASIFFHNFFGHILLICVISQTSSCSSTASTNQDHAVISPLHFANFFNFQLLIIYIVFQYSLFFPYTFAVSNVAYVRLRQINLRQYPQSPQILLTTIFLHCFPIIFPYTIALPNIAYVFCARSICARICAR